MNQCLKLDADMNNNLKIASKIRVIMLMNIQLVL